MEDIDYAKLGKYVKDSVAASFKERVDEQGKSLPNVANLGGKIHDILKLDRAGEYHGITVELLANTRPLLTDGFVLRLLDMMNKQDFVTPLSLLNLTSIDQLVYVLDTWFRKAVADYKGELSSLVTELYPKLDRWAHTATHHPIDAPIKVIGLGINEQGESILPESWVGREFASADEMQAEMSKLPHRLGKPPVTFAIIYTMRVQKNETVVQDLSGVKCNRIIHFTWTPKTKSFSSKIIPKTKVPKGSEFVVYNNDTVIAFKTDNLFEPKPPGQNDKQVGVLVSRLQKAIRRGRLASKAMVETVNQLNVSPNYNLPEHGFMRVSAAKQLCWRLYIAILEDCRPYETTNKQTVSLRDLIFLVLITQRATEYMFKPDILDAIRLLAVTSQFNDTKNDATDWRKYKSIDALTFGITEFQDSVYMAVNYLPMMSSDADMLRRLCTQEQHVKFGPYVSVPVPYPHDEKVYMATILASYDMHNKTNMILFYQAASKYGMTTKQVSSHIWNTSSSYNVRYSQPREEDELISDIQASYMEPIEKRKVRIGKNTMANPKLQSNPTIDSISKRRAFLILFGQEYRYKRSVVVLAGSEDKPARIQVKVGENINWEFSNEHEILNAFPKTSIRLNQYDPPEGYRWIEKTTVIATVKDGLPYIDGKEVMWFDGSELLTKINLEEYTQVQANLDIIGKTIFTGDAIDFVSLQSLHKSTNNKLCRWRPNTTGFITDLVKLVYTKIYNDTNGIIMVGPVSRLGQKMQNSIDYLLEGKTWAVLSFFSYLWPDALKPSGSLNFHLNKASQGYALMIECLEFMIWPDKRPLDYKIPQVTTKMWDHQIDSRNKAVAGYLSGKHGYGNASDVGAGKTLTAIAVAVELMAKVDTTSSGVLVMVPNDKLITTWTDELKKHTRGFEVFVHSIKATKVKLPAVTPQTIVITTMGRNRDHPIKHNWLLVVIDECLAVQNKDALWTGAAWTQSLMSDYLLMMSATFFRTRFDKLYYMLKMLQTGLPERKEYLNAILLESIVSQVSGVQRNWTSSFHYFTIDKICRAKYDEINNMELDVEAKFAKLMSFLTSNKTVRSQVTKQLRKLIQDQEALGRSCLIYARAMEEAKEWSIAMGIPIYPKKGKHCIVTYSDGTYGLNDLVQYNTIVMRPPAPDKLPQIKGRLDRPGQTENQLYTEYFVIEDTLEVGLILRMDIASQFVQRYIMPLAKFYDLSVNYTDYQ